MPYQNKQIGTALMLIMGIVLCINLILALVLGVAGLWPVFIILTLLTFLFSSLSIQVDNDEINWFFGPGFWKKSIKIESIKSATIIKTRWYYGLGIRLIPSGWLYNVSGTTAVQIELKEGTKIHLGSNDANKLLQAIQSRLLD